METTTTDTLIGITNLSKYFGTFQALKDVSLSVAPGERVVVCGPSGSGKSTLIRCINRLEKHEEGQIIVDGIELTDTRESLDKVRANVGMVFQQFNLFPHLTVLENLTLGPKRVFKISEKEARERALGYLERVRIADQADKYPRQLSGGQQQRVAIARALAGKPRFLLADEPTGNLDTARSLAIMELLTKLNAEGQTILMVTHEEDMAAYTRRILHFRDGKVENDERRAGA